MQRRTILASGAFLGLLMMVPTGFAATGATLTLRATTGATMPLEDDATRIERQKRALWLSLSEASDAGETALQAAREKSWKDRATVRAGCRKYLLATNKDDILSFSLKCIRADLQLERTQLIVEIESAQKLTGVQQRTKDLLVDRLKKMQNADTALIEGVDTGVFRDEKSIRDALKNLRAKYRAPLWEATDAARTERRLAAMSLLLTEMHAASGSVLRPELWKQSKDCLWVQEQIALKKMTPAASTGALTLLECLSRTKEVLDLQVLSTGTGAVVPAK